MSTTYHALQPEQGIINHVAKVLDASGSMDHLKREVVQVADGQIAHLAKRSQELDQETRATVYQFDTQVKCFFYDKDVLRLPSLAGKYRIGGSTALIDATMQAILDLEKSAVLYGDHAFLVYVLTDGMENASRRYRPSQLRDKLESLPDNWTVAALVPDKSGEYAAENVGFHKGNIAQWSQTVEGIREVAKVVQQATENFMVARQAGIRGSRNLFNMNVEGVQVAKLIELDPAHYNMLPVGQGDPIVIRDFVNAKSKTPYRVGRAYYQLTKPEDVQPQKVIVVRENKTGHVYTGSQARRMLGLPSYTVKVNPVSHPDYTIFVQSTSVNRKLVPGTNLLVMAR